MVKYDALALKPIGHMVLIELEETRDRTKAGVLVPRQAREREEAGGQWGKVLAIGGKAYEDFPRDEHPKVGDTVWFQRYAGEKIYSNQFLEVGEEKLSRLKIVADNEIRVIVRA